ncbi:non-ribosomal peptide synthetase, partial [Paenibacillus xylaniclasticus]|uniref:non-ribosomal peptide synthetase n=1 Tax=Paenibacillus xylaniclasticus TaxID=588083 RepID=UPI000FDCABE9
MTHMEHKPLFPLTHPQSRIWYTEMMYPQSDLNHIAFSSETEQELDFRMLKTIIRRFVNHQDAFRIRLTMEQGHVTQYFDSDSHCAAIEFVKLEEPSGLDELLKRKEPFQADPTHCELYKFYLYELGERRGFIAKFHHLIADGWSSTLLIDYVWNEYIKSMNKAESIIEDTSHSVPSGSYLRYMESEQKYLSSKRFERHEQFWLNKFQSLPEHLPKPSASLAASRTFFVLDEQQDANIKSFVQEKGITVPTFFMSIFYIYLNQVERCRDLTLGTPVYNRSNREARELFGMCTSTMPVRLNSSPDQSVSELLAYVHAELQRCYFNQKYPYDLLVPALKRTNPELTRLFEYSVNFLNYRFIPSLHGKPIVTNWHHSGSQEESLTLTIAERHEQKIIMIYDYKTELYSEPDIIMVHKRIQHIINQVLRSTDLKLSEIEIVTPDERQRLDGFNQTSIPYPSERTLVSMFEEQAAKSPDAIAAVYQEEKLTYRELNARANQLAHRLRAEGVLPGHNVAVMAARSLEMLVGIYGILKAGAAYLPIDPDYPQERISYMLRDSGAQLLLVENVFETRVGAACKILALHDDGNGDWPSCNPESGISGSDLAYIIYTSGSTGQPKGVMIEHHAVVNRLVWMQRQYPLQAKDVLLQKTPLSFDVSVWELFWWAFNGASVCLLEPGGEKDPAVLMQTIAASRVSVLHFVPSMLNAWLEAVEYGTFSADLSSVKRVFTSGEALHIGQVNRFYDLTEAKGWEAALINLYGPTEATVDVTYFDCTPGLDIVPIGKPIDNTKLYIVGEQMQLMPIGAVGELCIAGAGLARGYLNRPELTDQKFVSNPFEAGGRMYRTGDLARWLPDGNIEYLGRMDSQVKVRGYRIELGEVEAQLLQIADVLEAAVIIRDDHTGHKQLCGYYTAARELPSSEVRGALTGRLPSYMIPAYFIQLPSMPLSPNGKLDRRALPQPEDLLTTKATDRAPRTPEEKALVSICSSVLGHPNIGVQNHFFESGGDSIKILQVISKLAQAGYKLEMRDAFTYPILEQMSLRLTPLTYATDQRATIGEVKPTPVISWYMEGTTEPLHHFNQSIFLYRQERFDIHALSRALEKIVNHHDALRIIMRREQAGWMLWNRGADEGELYSLEVIDCQGSSFSVEMVQARASELQANIDLNNGPLMRLALFQCPDGDHLLIVIHHLAVDGYSWRILLEDLSQAYDQALRGEEPTLPLKTDSFQTWANQLHDYAAAEAVYKELPYWLDIEQTCTCKLPKDMDESASLVCDTETVEITWSREETELLLKDAHRAYNTEVNDLLLTALSTAICTWSGRSELTIDMEGHGREGIFPGHDFSRTVGWFTSIYPVVLSNQANSSLRHQIKALKEQLRSIPNKGIGYGILRYLSSTQSNRSHHLQARPEILFNYLGQLDHDLQSSALQLKLSPYDGGARIDVRSVRKYVLELIGAVKNGQLTMEISYSSKQYRRGTIEKLATELRKALSEVLLHCSAKQQPELTPSDIVADGISIDELEELTERLGSIVSRTIENIYPLTPMQKGMLFHSLVDNEPEAFVQQISLTLQGALEIELFRSSWNAVTRRHDALRTNFLMNGREEPLQIVYQDREILFHYEDIQEMTMDKQQQYIYQYVTNDRSKGFDLAADPLMRVSVIRKGETEYQLVWSHHHIVLDGWCLALLIQEVFTHYSAYRKGCQPDLPAAVPYHSYLSWLTNRDTEAAGAYWRTYLQGYEGISTLPKRMDADQRAGHVAQVLETEIGISLTKQISIVAKQQGVTLNTVLQTAWAIVLQKYNGTEDVVFGSIVSGRPAEIPEIDQMIGLCINVIPVRVACSPEESAAMVLRKVQHQAIDSHAHDHYPLYEIQAQVKQDQVLIDHVLVFENYPLSDNVSKLGERTETGLHCSDLSIHEQTNYDLNLIIFAGEELRFRFLYNGNVYDPQVVEGISDSLVHVLNQIAHRPEMSIGDFELLSEQAFIRQQSRYQLRTDTDYSNNQTVHEMFELQAERTPDAVAVEADGIRVTYRELNERSNQLARVLELRGVGRDRIVGLMMYRSARYIEFVMAVLKAGGAILPIDPDNPADRIRYILDHSQPVLVISETPADQAVLGDAVLLLAEAAERESISMPSTNLNTNSKSTDALYVIYTSGSTGVPKGVLLEHRTIVNLMQWQTDHIPVVEGVTRITQFASMSFDVCYQEIFTALLNGARLHIIPEELKKLPKALIEEIVSSKADIVFLPTAYLKFIASMKMLLDQLSLSCVKHLVVAGEQLVIHPLLRSYLQENGVILHNHYGPSETHVVTAHAVKGQDAFIPSVPPIGMPIANTSIFILDRNGCPLPDGAIGELCIGGAGLAREYINRPELTDERFVPHPLSADERIYRTGDLARRLPDGTLEYLGRIDQQVKIRGYRVEPGEIESHLLNIKPISEAVVLALDDVEGGKYLCAYVVAPRKLVPEELRAMLGEKLPAYMIPSFFVQLDRMPLTVNGKVDRRALPLPDRKALREKTYKAPRSLTERKLADIWKSVLRLEQVGTDDHFFHIGGHSLTAASLSGLISRDLFVQLSIQDIFRHPTLESMAQLVESRTIGAFAPIPKADIREHYPVSSAQQRIYLSSQLTGGGLSYNMPGALRIEGHFDLEKANEALRTILYRHESLRTAFRIVNGAVVQKIEEEVPFRIELIEASGEEEAAILHRFIRPFNLSKAPLLRVSLVTLETDRYLLLFDMHHIISDGVSLQLLAHEFVELYQGQELQALPIQYKDYTQWQQSPSYRQALEPHLDYWMNVFRDGVPLLELPTDYPRQSVNSFQGGQVHFRIDRLLTDGIKKLARKQDVTLYMTLLAAFNVLLFKYTGEQDIVVGSPVAGREHPDVEPLIGVFINTLALRSFPEGSKTFRKFLAEVGERTLEAFEHQAYPFEELVEALQLPRDVSRNPLFNVMLVLQNTKSISVSTDGLSIETMEADPGAVKVDLTLTLTEDADGLQANLTYASDLYKQETAERMADHFVQLLQSVVEEPDRQLKDISIMTKHEQHTVLELFNQTAAAYPAESTVHRLFEEQVERSPDAAAIIFGEERITYAELNARANQVAHKLRSCGVRADSIVGIMTERSVDMMVGIFGILKAGGAYLPLDPAYPVERIRFMLEDSAAMVLLSNVDGMEWFEGEVLELREDSFRDQPNYNPEAVSRPSDLAYVIYTSGSTGKPKGVMIEHHSVINRLHWMQKKYKITEGDVILQKTPISFDVSVWELFWWSWYGAAVCLLTPGGEKDPAQIAAAIAEHHVTTMHFVPPMLGAFLDYLDTHRDARDGLGSLKHVFASGQALLKGQVERFYDLLGGQGVQLVNLYGPTEATVDVSAFDCRAGLDRIPIGKPIDNIRLYVVDRYLRPLPVGIPGELCIAGVGLARGYLGRPELTEERFVADVMRPDERMYRTGDIARWLPDGHVEYLGRMDHQVKIRGNRIELGEIEEKLLSHELVREATVIDRTDEYGTSYLVAYVVAEQNISAYEYRKHLAHSLPAYMIPAYFVSMDRLPLTPNGKLNRQALPAPDLSQGAAPYAEPETAQEWMLTNIWSEVLGGGRIGVHDPFFQIGGDSIKLIRVANRIHQVFGIQVELRELYTYQSIREIADYMKQIEFGRTNVQLEQGLELVRKFQEQIRKEASLQHYLQRGVTDYYPLSKIQSSMVYYSKLKPNEPIYHDQFFFRATISPFNTIRMQQVTRMLTARHDILRTVFDTVHFSEPVQLVYGQVEPDLTIEDIRHLSIEHQKQHIEASRQQDLADKYLTDDRLLWRLRIFQTGDEEAVILLSFHHAALDGWSVAVFQQEFMELYNQADAWEDVTTAPNVDKLPALRTSYKEYVALNAYKMTDEQTVDYWHNYLSGYTRGKLPFNIGRKMLANTLPSSIINRTVKESMVRKLEESASHYGCHVKDLCLAAHLYLLRIVTAEKDVVTGVVSHDRPAVQDGDRILGCFLNSLPMRIQLGKREEKQALLRRVSDTLYQMKAHELFLSDIARMIGEKTDAALNPIFDILFNYTDFHVVDYSEAGGGVRPEEADGLELEGAEMTNTLLDVEVHRSGKRMNVQIKYSPQYFYEQDMETVFTLYVRILEKLCDTDNRYLDSV